ncbi:MAG: hypothetical protein HDS88_06635 [Bacteroidales bacterium]|nr:hypothetical protein [Bacteroidales bacterium]
MEQPYRANVLIVKSVGMLPGASVEFTTLSMNVLYRLHQLGETSPYTGLCGCSMEQSYRANMLVVKSVGMLLILVKISNIL